MGMEILAKRSSYPNALLSRILNLVSGNDQNVQIAVYACFFPHIGAEENKFLRTADLDDLPDYRINLLGSHFPGMFYLPVRHLSILTL